MTEDEIETHRTDILGEQDTNKRKPANFIPGLTEQKIFEQAAILREDGGKYQRQFKHDRKFKELNIKQRLV